MLIFSSKPVIQTTRIANSRDFINPAIPPVRNKGISIIRGPRVG